MFVVNRAITDAYFPTPFDIEISEAKITYYELANIRGSYFLANYDAKNSSSQKLGNSNFWKNYLQKNELSNRDLENFVFNKDAKSGVFIEHNQVGIGLVKKQTIEGAFYAKMDYSLSNNFLLGCIIELDSKIIENGIIQIGAESSLFELTITPLIDTSIINHPVIANIFEPPQKGEKIVAISDAILESTNEFHSHFTIVPYYKNFAMLNSDYGNFKGKTEQKRVIPSGTVSFINEQVMPYNPHVGAYAKMGYNQFITAKHKG
jgi:hypothetical protein